MFKGTIRVVVPLIALCTLCLFIATRTLNQYIVHPKTTTGQPLVVNHEALVTGGLLADPPVSRICICLKELVLTERDARGIRKGHFLTVSDGKKEQELRVEELGNRTFFHRAGKPAFDEYILPESERIPAIFIRTDKAINLAHGNITIEGISAERKE